MPSLRLRSDTSAPTVELSSAAKVEAPVPPSKGKKAFKPVLEILLVVVVLLALVALGVVVAPRVMKYYSEFRSGAKPATRPVSPPAAKPSVAKPAPVERPGEAGSSAVQPAARGESEPASSAAPGSVAKPSPVPAPKPEPAPAQAAAGLPEPGLPPASTPAAPVPAAPAPGTGVSQPAAPAPVIWPGFSLQAAMGGGKTGSVMIDGKIVPVGSAHGGVSVIEITPQGVVMEYAGERRTFRVRR